MCPHFRFLSFQGECSKQQENAVLQKGLGLYHDHDK